MLRLGHIEYSNCLPVHGPLIDGTVSAAAELVSGVPTWLNVELASGRIDVAPCSSIEYARHADRYRLLPDLAIGSCGAIGSILLESRRPLQSLGGRTVAVPTASATSVVLLRVLLELRDHAAPQLRWFDQHTGADPTADGADATLWIGDPALRRRFPAGRDVHDLGALWTAWTGLPFVFAVWQTRLGPRHDVELGTLHTTLLRARDHFAQHVDAYAAAYAGQFGVPAARLGRYWRALRLTLDEPMRRGLLRFYELAARLDEAPAGVQLRFVPALDDVAGAQR